MRLHLPPSEKSLSSVSGQPMQVFQGSSKRERHARAERAALTTKTLLWAALPLICVFSVMQKYKKAFFPPLAWLAVMGMQRLSRT